MPLDHSKSPGAFNVRHDVGSETLAYVAGLFDGEGCVNFTHSGQARTLVLRSMVRNTDRDIIDFLQTTFGGRIETSPHSLRPRWKPSYCWRLDGAAALEFLFAIEPWVRIKQEQIFLAKVYDAIRNREHCKIDDGYRKTLALLQGQLNWLNRKGRRQDHDIEPIVECLASLPVPVSQILLEAGYAIN